MGKINNDKTRARNLFNQDDLKCKTAAAIRLVDKSGKEGIVVCYQFRTPENIGNVIRLASNFGCQRVIVITKEDEIRQSKVKKLAGAAVGFVQIDYCTEDKFWDKLPKDYSVIAIETSINSKDISKTKLPDKVVFLLGNERTGLSNETVEKCDGSVHIPMFGDIKSMNVSHACAVALYQWRCE